MQQFITFSLLGFLIAVSSAVLQYEVGITHRYEYETTVHLTEAREGASKVTYQIAGPVDVTALWQNPNQEDENLILIQFSPRLRVKPKDSDVLSDHTSTLDTKTGQPVVVRINEGRIVEFFASSQEDEDILNLRRAVASLFQLSDHDNERQEVDASGKCHVTYRVSGKKVHKVKNGCEFNNGKEWFAHSTKVLSADLTRVVESNYDVQQDIVQSVESHEKVTLNVRTLPNSGTVIETTQKLKITGQQPSTLTVQGSTIEELINDLSIKFHGKFIPTQLPLTETSKTCTTNCKSLLALVKEWKEGLFPKNIAKTKASLAFLKLVNQCRQSTKQDILEALKSTNNKKIQIAFIEAIIAAQTSDSYEVILDHLPSVKDDGLTERFLLALAVLPRPTLIALEKMTKIVEKNSFKSLQVGTTAVLVLGAMLNRVCHSPTFCEDKVTDKAISLLTKKLQKCQDDDCSLTYLRALRNAALPKTIPNLIPLIKDGKKPAKWSLQVLQAMKLSSIPNELRVTLLRVFHQSQKKYDTTCRLMAADLLLSAGPTEEEVAQIIQALKTFDETSTYLASRLKELAESSPELRSILKNLLSNQEAFGNYNVHSQPGISTAFTKLLAATSEGNSTYGLHLELAEGGILKQSAFDVHVNSEDSQLPIFRFGLFAGGLESFVGTVAEESEDEEAQDATAGMELVIFDVALRPYVFFVGQSELMGHVWSGTASDPTPIAQGNFLLHDFWQQVALQSGLVATFKVGGALSADMSGSLKISVWNRNAHSEIVAKGATVLQSSILVDTSYIRSSVDLAVSSEASLNFVTDSEFYEAPFKMCTQMNQPSFLLRYLIRKVEHIPNSKHTLRKTRKVSSTVNGRSFDLHPKNSALCRLMLSQ